MSDIITHGAAKRTMPESEKSTVNLNQCQVQTWNNMNISRHIYPVQHNCDSQYHPHNPQNILQILEYNKQNTGIATNITFCQTFLFTLHHSEDTSFFCGKQKINLRYAVIDFNA